MAEPIRIRAQAAGDRAVVRVLMTHPMETGQRKDGAGRLLPAHYIREVSATLNGRVVLNAEWGPAVSKNPYLQFTLKGASPGDRVGVSWRDNLGQTRSDDALVV